MVKVEEYDKEEEERRLLYVAMSRAKQSLYLSYSGKGITPFLTRELISLIDPGHEALKQSRLSDYSIHPVKHVKAKADSRELIARLQEWRRKTSEALGVPPFMIMHDKTLYDLAERMPLHEDDLRKVYGLGPAKIRKYGDELIDLMMS
jgi:superfamily II DNA helicase RecQ